jgi:hypothetical protein
LVLTIRRCLYFPDSTPAAKLLSRNIVVSASIYHPILLQVIYRRTYFICFCIFDHSNYFNIFLAQIIFHHYFILISLIIRTVKHFLWFVNFCFLSFPKRFLLNFILLC